MVDLDNNGYLDTLRNKDNGVYHVAYATFMDANGVLDEGWLCPTADKFSRHNLETYYYFAADELYVGVYENNNNYQLYPVITQSDERPAAPTGIRATQTDNGLLISWNAAVDDHTPANAMHYNLSVKRRGMTGAGAYIVSPQNGENDNAAFIPGYEYISGTQYLIPASELYAGTLEIRLQALDRQNKLSVFSDIVTTTILRDPLEVPSFTCAGEDVTVAFQGEVLEFTPVWDFDGGTVVSGSGYGPYTIAWYDGGEKTVSVTIDGQTYSKTITVDDPAALPIRLFTEMVKDVDYTVNIPRNVTFSGFWVEYDGRLRPIDGTGIITNYGNPHNPNISVPVAYSKCMSANGSTIRINSSTPFILPDPFILYLQVTTENGCTGYVTTEVSIVDSETPVLTLVTTDAEGHNIVSWKNTNSFANVKVYKEGNSLNQFNVIATVPASAYSYTDLNSNSEQKAERYRIAAVTSFGSESAASDIHKTVHLTINRGVDNGTFNLIWNMYEGAEVAAYTILRGESPTSMEMLAHVAASTTSYTDRAPVDSKPYYAIEYTLIPPESNSPQRQGEAVSNRLQGEAASRRLANNELVGRSNVVNRAATALEDIPAGEIKSAKLFIDGHLYILRDGVLYPSTGAKVR